MRFLVQGHMADKLFAINCYPTFKMCNLR